jgi:hypothetical protein
VSWLAGYEPGGLQLGDSGERACFGLPAGKEHISAITGGAGGRFA